jgi:hypothetical protein
MGHGLEHELSDPYRCSRNVDKTQSSSVYNSNRSGPKIHTSIYDRQLTAMIDYGATHSYIRNSVAQSFVAKNKLNLRSNSQKVLLADNSTVFSMNCAILPVSVGDSFWVSPIRVIKYLSVYK